MMLKIALHIARKDYEQQVTKQASGIAKEKEADESKPLEQRTCTGRKADTFTNAKIVEQRGLGFTIAAIAKKLSISESQVKLILKKDAVQKAAYAIRGATIPPAPIRLQTPT